MSAASACHARHSRAEIGLRAGALVVILVTSLAGTLFPVVAKRVPYLRRNVPGGLFEFLKLAGSGVILATALIHLLEPAVDMLSADNPCVGEGWGEYPYAVLRHVPRRRLLRLHFQLFATRIGNARLSHLNNSLPASSPAIIVEEGDNTLSRSSTLSVPPSKEKEEGKVQESLSRAVAFHDAFEENPLSTQLIATATLEFGICFHSVIIGITLAVTEVEEFRPLFIVLVFHQMFEGLGVGARLAALTLPSQFAWVPWVGGVLYSVCTPVGMAVGLGIEQGLAVESTELTVTAGVMYALSAGILLYTALVELMAHELVFNKFYQTCSIWRLSFSLVSFAVGALLMALLGKWA